MHEECDAVLPAFPVLELGALTVSAQSTGGQEVGQPAGAVGRFRERAAPRAADRHQPVGDRLSDGVEDAPESPLTHS